METKNEYEPCTIKAILKRIIYQTPETGFLIGSFQPADTFDDPDDPFADDLPFSALGKILTPQVGMAYMLTGEWGDSPKFGRQFKIIAYETVEPADVNGIYKYLVRIAKYVGPTVGARLVKAFGADTLTVMRTDPARVAEHVKGITHDRAVEIQEILVENQATEKQMVELEAMLDIPGMRKALPTELIKRFKSNAVAAVKENPYILTTFSGIGFSLADRVALKIGYPRAGIFRKMAAAIHCVHEAGQARGDVWVPGKQLVDEMRVLIQVEDLSAGIHRLVADGVFVERDGAFAIAARAEDEAYIAGRIFEMIS